jgi:N-acetylglutamate synthase-like GNAT family acetyltransferase
VLGRELGKHLIGEAEAKGLGGLDLLTTTAERYFPGFGFRAVSRADVPADVRETEEFRSACPASAAVMALALPGRR